MANAIDLATVQDIKNYLYSGQPASSIPSGQDAIIGAYLTAVSSFIAYYLGRTFQEVNTLPAQAWTEIRTGNGAQMMRLRARPIVSVSSVVVNQTSLNVLAAGTLAGAGVVYDKSFVYIRGGFAPAFFPSLLGVEFQYTGGFNTPGMSAVAALPDWIAQTLYPAGFQINHAATGIVYTAVNGGLSGAVAPTFPTALGAIVADGGGVNVGLQSIVESGTIVTAITQAAHNLSPNQQIAISGVNLAGYNGIFTVQTTPTPTSFTYVAASAGLGAGGGGVVTATGLSWQADAPALPLISGASALPQDIRMAAIQMAALVYKQRGRVGDQSLGEGPSRNNYFMGAMSKTTEALLAPHIDYAAAIEGGEIVPSWAAAG